MKRILSFGVAVALCLTTATAAFADGPTSSGITDQSYKGGKYSGNAAVMNNCPREYRGMYRGNLYCRSPQYQVIAPRHHLCPEGFKGMYRGNLYCVSGRG